MAGARKATNTVGECPFSGAADIGGAQTVCEYENLVGFGRASRTRRRRVELMWDKHADGRKREGVRFESHSSAMTSGFGDF